MNITVLGAGAFGGALGSVLVENYHTIQYFDPYKYPDVTLEQALTFVTDVEASGKTYAEIAPQAEAILLAVPSSVALELLPKLPKDIPLINASKGFLSLRPFERFADFSVISGPAFANDLAEKKPVTLTATSALVEELFANDWLKFDRASDELGVLLCGTLKNVYAIGAGYYANSQVGNEEDFCNRALAEMKIILKANGASAETAELACGVGDLTLTCSSTTSRNYQFGRSLASNDFTIPEGTTVEGLSALNLIKQSPDFNIPKECIIIKNIQELVHGHSA